MHLFLMFKKARIIALSLAMFSCFYGFAQLTVTSGLKLHLDAAVGFNDNGSLPSTWGDLSSAGNTLVSGTGLGEPVQTANAAGSGFSGIFFDGVDDYMINQTLNNSMKDSLATIFVVQISPNVRSGATGTNYTAMVSVAQDSTWLNEMGIGADWGLHHSSNGNMQYLTHDCFDSLPPNKPIIMSTMLGAQPQDIFYQIFGSASTIPTGVIGAPVAYPSTPVNRRIVLGARFTDDIKTTNMGYFFGGYILEVIMYNRKLTPAEIANVNTYLKDKYYTSITPPTGTLTGSDICDGENVYLTYTLPGGVPNPLIEFTDGTANYKRTVQNGVPFQMTPTPSVTTTYTTVVPPVLDVCSFTVPGGPSSSVTINVYPAANADAGRDTLVCPNETIQLKGTGNGTYLWFPSDSMNDATLANPTVKVFKPTIYRFAVTNTFGCSDTDQVSVGFKTSAFSVFPKETTTICKGDSVQLFAYGGYKFTWTPNVSISDTSIANPLVAPDSDMTYVVAILQGECDFAATLPVSVKVNPRPKAVVSHINDIGCDKVSVQLAASGGIDYYWFPIGELSNPNIPNPIATPKKETNFTVRVSNEYGCTDTASIFVDAVDAKRMIKLANAFTPNGDGLNDCYEIKIPFPVLSYDFNIFNRWGNKVFHTSNTSDCWNGQYNGKLQDLGTFYYTYRIKSDVCGELHGEGSIHLIR